MDIIAVIGQFFTRLGQADIDPKSFLPLLQYASEFAIAVLFLASTRYMRRRLRWRVVMRALFRKSQWLNRSTFVDCCYVVANTFVFGGLVSLLTLTNHGVYNHLHPILVTLFGQPSPAQISATGLSAIMMVLAYIGYEFGYFVDHYLAHKVPFLWEFHKVHHAATSLTPLTNFRVHPVDTIVFFNIIAIVISILQVIAGYVLGSAESAIDFPQNFFLLAYYFLYAHLQHTHVWIPATGWAGHIFCSPAHHQIHHSTQPRHFDKNFGSSLVVFDWLFGTLYVPSHEREVKSVGVGDDRYVRSFIPSLIMPCLTAPLQLFNSLRRSLHK